MQQDHAKRIELARTPLSPGALDVMEVHHAHGRKPPTEPLNGPPAPGTLPRSHRAARLRVRCLVPVALRPVAGHERDVEAITGVEPAAVEDELLALAHLPVDPLELFPVDLADPLKPARAVKVAELPADLAGAPAAATGALPVHRGRRRGSGRVAKPDVRGVPKLAHSPPPRGQVQRSIATTQPSHSSPWRAFSQSLLRWQAHARARSKRPVP